MFSRVFSPAVLVAIAFAASPSHSATAQDGLAEELKALRLLVEKQGKQLDLLAAQLARLTARLEGGSEPPTAPPVVERATPPAGEPGEYAIPTARPVAPPANVYIIVKGDNLEKIAKMHGTSIAEILKFNRITDPKKLQIGQQIMLPPSAPKKDGQ